MASVRMTNELRIDIRRNAERAYELANPEPKPNNDYVAAVRAAVINSPEQTYLRDTKKIGEERGITKNMRTGPNILPYEPKEFVTGIELRRALANFTQAGRNHHRDYDETAVKFTSPLANYLMVGGDNHRWGDPVVWIEDLRDEDKTQILEHYDSYIIAKQEYYTALRNYEGSIRDLLNNCTTLKQLLQIWPAAESLVPSDKIQKMHVKVTRAQRAAAIKEEVCFDPTIANQAVLTAKMLGG